MDNTNKQPTNDGSQDEDVEDSPPKIPYRRDRTPSIVVQSLGLSFNKDSNITESIELTGDDEEEDLSRNSNSSEVSDPKSSTSGIDDAQGNVQNIGLDSSGGSAKGSSNSLQSPGGGASLSPIGGGKSNLVKPSGGPNLIASTNRRLSLNIGTTAPRRQSLTVEGLSSFVKPQLKQQAQPKQETYSGGNATGSLRNKVSLAPGYSLMGWIKLTNEDVDLAGNKGKIMEVSSDELAKHNTKEDCWIALRGQVYNVTRYLDYHPGGPDEIMRSAGGDATDLFNEVHRWINYPVILAKCLIGPYKADSPLTPTGRANFKTMTESKSSIDTKTIDGNETKTTNRKDPTVARKAPRRQSIALTVPETNHYNELLLHNNSTTNLNQVQQPPTYVIMQDKSCIKIKIQDLKTLPLIRARHLICDLNANMELHLSIILSMDWLYRVHLRFQQPIEEHFTASLSNDDRTITILLNKREQSIWNKIGTSLDLNDSLCEMNLADKFFRPCQLASKKRLTHDTYLFEFKLDQTLMYVPIGWHVLMREYSCSTIKPRQQKDNLDENSENFNQDDRVFKNYTPVLQTILDNDGQTDESGFMDRLHFIIKIYPEGLLTTKLNSLQVGDYIEISDYQYVDFNVEQEIMTPKHWFLFAAGTGITPFCRTISYLLSQSEENVKSVTLVFYNKTQEDIILKDEFDKLAEDQTNKRFKVHYILSNEPISNGKAEGGGSSSSWQGERGRIQKEQVAKLLDSHNPDEVRLLACGPRPFTQLAKTIAADLNLAEKLHVFHG